jgi:hypothetical protein
MRVPEEYVVDEVLSPGPFVFVARGRRNDGEPCVLKGAATTRGLGAVEREAAVLRALGAAGVRGVPRLLDVWDEGFAAAWLPHGTLRAAGPLFGDVGARNAIAHHAFARLAEIHAARHVSGAALGVVHGDVSPDNVYVPADASGVTFADFGLARWTNGPVPEAGAFRGTLGYAAPEVVRAEPFDARADDFALAASLLHIATGIALYADAGSEAANLVRAGTTALDASHPWRALASKLFNFTTAEALLACLAFDARDRPRETPRPC